MDVAIRSLQILVPLEMDIGVEHLQRTVYDSNAFQWWCKQQLPLVDINNTTNEKFYPKL